MRYHALVTDYDGTLAHHGRVDEPTTAALKRLRESGRRLLMVTGRELPELLGIFPEIHLFDRVIAENGALLYRPETKEEKTLAEPPPERFIKALEARGVGPISVGRVIVATWEPHENAVLEVIREQGLELHVIFNKGAVMILPSGVNKATGLAFALEELGLSAHNAVGVGDAENDHAFLAACECAVAVANALPALKERADLVTAAPASAGVAELIHHVLADDLADASPRLTRHNVLLGKTDAGTEEWVEPYGINLLVAGTSGSGKSTITAGLLERLGEKGYQFVVIDPEGDYPTFDGAIVLGDAQRPPPVEEVLDVLKEPGENAIVNLLGIGLEHRPEFFDALLPRLQEMRTRTGRPHWIVVDEAHHLMPAIWGPAIETMPREAKGMLFITVHPESVAAPVRNSVDLVLAVGEAPEKTIAAFCEGVGACSPPLAPTALETGEVLAWWRGAGRAPVRVHTEPPRTERLRHSRKYAEGNLGLDRSFFFRGPEHKLNLRAQNLAMFLQLAAGVDDATWLYHLRRHEYSAWVRDAIKDAELADEVSAIEDRSDLLPRQSRAAVREAVERRYTLPADRPSGLIDRES